MAKILVIDDYPPMRDILEVLLPTEGHEVSTAADGPAGLLLAGNKPFDLALIDVDLPGTDGISVCRALKGSPETRHLQVLMMTGRPRGELHALARLAGARAVMAKPFPGRALLAEIARVTGADDSGFRGDTEGRTPGATPGGEAGGVEFTCL